MDSLNLSNSLTCIQGSYLVLIQVFVMHPLVGSFLMNFSTGLVVSRSLCLLDNIWFQWNSGIRSPQIVRLHEINSSKVELCIYIVFFCKKPIYWIDIGTQSICWRLKLFLSYTSVLSSYGLTILIAW
jgi:hypothetical protein